MSVSGASTNNTDPTASNSAAAEPSFKEAASEGMGKAADFVIGYIDSYPKITGVALVALCLFSFLTMAHVIDFSLKANILIGSIAVGLGLTVLLLKKFVVKDRDPNVSKTRMEKVIDIIAIIAVALVLAFALYHISPSKSFFDGAGIMNMMFFGLTMGLGTLGTVVLIESFRNKRPKESSDYISTAYKIAAVAGLIGYYTGVIGMMSMFGGKGDLFSCLVTTLFFLPSEDLVKYVVGICLKKSANKRRVQEEIELQSLKTNNVSANRASSHLANPRRSSAEASSRNLSSSAAIPASGTSLQPTEIELQPYNSRNSRDTNPPNLFPDD